MRECVSVCAYVCGGKAACAVCVQCVRCVCVCVFDMCGGVWSVFCLRVRCVRAESMRELLASKRAHLDSTAYSCVLCGHRIHAGIASAPK